MCFLPLSIDEVCSDQNTVGVLEAFPAIVFDLRAFVQKPNKKSRELDTGIRQRASHCSAVPWQDQCQATRSESVDCTNESRTTGANMLFSIATCVRANLVAYRANATPP